MKLHETWPRYRWSLPSVVLAAWRFSPPQPPWFFRLVATAWLGPISAWFHTACTACTAIRPKVKLHGMTWQSRPRSTRYDMDMTWIWHGYDMFIPSKSAEEMAGNRSDVPRHWFAGLQSDDKNGEKGWNMLKKCWVDDYWWLLMIIDDYCWLLMYIDVYWCMKQAEIKSAKSWETPDSSHSQASMYQVT